MHCALKYHFNAVEREAYQKSTHCQNVTNHSPISRHCMMQGNTLQSTGYWLVSQYNCLQTTQCEVPQPRVGQQHFTELSQVHLSKVILKHTCYKHTLVSKNGTTKPQTMHELTDGKKSNQKDQYK